MASEEPAVVAEVAVSTIGATVAVVAEEKIAVDAVVGKPKKGKKTSSTRKPAIPALHPPYLEMIKDAIVTLKDKSGSSQYAIAKFIEEKQKSLPDKFKKVLLIQLKRLVTEGKLVKVKASYKLSASKFPSTAAPAKKKPAAKPKVSGKPKPAAKKAPAKTKPAAKPKAATKAKTVPKAKPVAKPKAVAKPKPVVKAKAADLKAVAKSSAKVKSQAPVKPTKVAKTTIRSTPGKKAAVKRVTAKPPPKKAAATKKAKK